MNEKDTITIEKLLRTQFQGNYYGRVIDTVSLSPFAIKEIEEMGMKLLKQIPKMLRASLNAKLINRVWVSQCFGKGSNYYLVEAVDGKTFMVE